MYNLEKNTFKQNYNAYDNAYVKSGSEKIWERFKKGLNNKKEKKLTEFEKEIKKGVPFEDADDVVEEVRRIVPPILSVPKKYFNKIKSKGFVEPKPDWTGHRSIAAVLGRSPYVPKNEERIYFKLSPQVKVEPRFMPKNKIRKTASELNKDDAMFYGVVLVSDGQKRLYLDHDLKQISD